jgi:hypothetical protein
LIIPVLLCFVSTMLLPTSSVSLLVFVVQMILLTGEISAFLEVGRRSGNPIAFRTLRNQLPQDCPSSNVVMAKSESQRKVMKMHETLSRKNVSEKQGLESRRSVVLNTLLSWPLVALVASAQPAAASMATSSTIHYANSDDIMFPKEHGTSSQPVQSNLLYGVDNGLADKICNFNRHFAEPSGYFTKTTLMDMIAGSGRSGEPLTFYDSVTGVPLFRIPGAGRTIEDFVAESSYHGWPSFRDNEVVWENLRVLRNSGEVVSTTGTHLGHNLPDKRGNRHCINLVSVAGQPK